MFSSRRYQPVSQHVESESDSDEATIFSVENGNSAKQKGEWHFGVRAYDLNQDLDLPQIRPTHHHPSRRSKDNLHGYTRKQALFGACVFVVIVTVITTLAVLILMKESNTTTITDDSANEDCNKAPKPIVNFAGGDVGSPPPPGCGKGNVTTEQKNTSPPPTQPRPATTSSETVSNVETEASPSKGGTKAPPSREGVTETRPQLPLTTHTAEAIQQKTTTLPEVPMTNSEAPPTTIPLDEGDIMKSTTPQSAAELPTATTQSHVTTTTSQDEQLLKNWSEKIASEITQPAVHLAQTTTQQPTQPESTESTQTPPTTTLTPPTNMSTPPTTTLILPTEEATSVNEECNKAPKPLVNFVDGDVSSPPPPGCGKEKEQQNTTSESSKDKDKVSEAPTMKPQSIDWEQDFFPAMSEATIELFDMNSDGVMDVVTVEDFSQCAARVVAMDGQNGTKFWQKVVNFPAFGVHCELDVNSDGTKDCLVTGRGAGFVAINGQNGSLLWDVDPSIAFPLYNFYFPLIVEDLDDDGVSDIINMHGGDVSYNPDEHNRSPGYLVVVSGKTGQSLFPPMLTPDGHESYMSPVLFKLNGKDNLVLFGSGGETVPGSLWAVSLTSIRNQVILNRARQSWKGGVVYEPFVNDTHHPCFMKGTDFNKIRPTFDHQAFDFKRPIFVTSAANSMRFCPSWEKVSPIWNKYGVCLYELYRAESKGVMVPPVIVDLNLDGIDDVVVSSFDGHTVALNGSDAATRLWDAYYPNTESYR